MDLTEQVARALWDIVPYDRVFEWDEHPNEDVREHYRERARNLLSQFVMYPKYTPEVPS
ncbi:hypothetical protein FGG47_gp34 [Mycobacterium phage Rebeuca]|uniref:Uncharacterized protein n=2 Tax=Fromanvirus rebeuca TaxID=1225862 RepID=A0A482JID7_9CAUD|nr:hypothetical protein FGG47_gp34 [Mycobacterium phage Rebeuca]AFQ97368.1 hypothetical protein REBEUCA_61 [Mycobacterium phage Rebeuca]QBP32009.1 hypothetical protein SEA_KRISTOFF_60 [Mycobacterium phage Kristoff]